MEPYIWILIIYQAKATINFPGGRGPRSLVFSWCKASHPLQPFIQDELKILKQPMYQIQWCIKGTLGRTKCDSIRDKVWLAWLFTFSRVIGCSKSDIETGFYGNESLGLSLWQQQTVTFNWKKDVSALVRNLFKLGLWHWYSFCLLVEPQKIHLVNKNSTYL